MTKHSLDQQLIFDLLDNQPESVIYYVPVYGEPDDTIIDFEIGYCNRQAPAMAHIERTLLAVQRVRTMINTTEEVRKNMFAQILEVFETGTPVETTYYNSMLNKHFNVMRTKVGNGVLVIGHDKTKEVVALDGIQKQAAFTNSILDTSINAIFACEAIRNPHGEIIDLLMQRINPAFTQLLRLPEDQVIGKTYLSLFPSAKKSGIFNINCQVINTGVPARKVILYDGEELRGWYDISLSKLGKDGLVVTFTDITESKEAQAETEHHRTLIGNILQHSTNGISVIEAIRNQDGTIVDGRTIIANEAASKYTGIPKDLLTIKSLAEIDPNIPSSPVFQMALSTLQTGEPFITQYYFKPSGKWLELSISKMDNDHLINIFTDVTPIKEGQLQLEASIEELKRSNASLEEFSYAASHDLKEPIRKVQVFTDRLKAQLESRLEEDEKWAFERLENATQRMRLLVDDLLAYSQVSHFSGSREKVDLNNKVRLVLTDLELEIEQQHANIEIGPLPVIEGYRRQLQQLFQNLISNALKYHKPESSPAISITSREVTGRQVPATLPEEAAHKLYHFIEIKDNGIGFKQENAERIFQMFHRLHSNSEYNGTGLGLTIVKKVVENHNGYITAIGEPGMGARFHIYLPKEGDEAANN